MSLLVTVIRETKNAEGDTIRSSLNTEAFSPGELASLLKYELFCGYPSQSPIDMSVGSDLTNVYLNQDVSEGDRECIEKGFIKNISIHYEREQPKANAKYWRKMFVLLEQEGRIIH